MMSPLWGLLFIIVCYYKHVIPTGLFEPQKRIIIVKYTPIKLQALAERDLIGHYYFKL